MKFAEALAILGLAKGVDLSDLKKRYRALALQYHPDKNNADDANKCFAQINNAYDVAFEILADDADDFSRRFDEAVAETRTAASSAFFGRSAKPKPKPKPKLVFSGGWKTHCYGGHVFITVPSLETSFSQEIVFFNVGVLQPQIKLPINLNLELKKFITSQLVPFIPWTTDWLQIDDIEITIRLPKDKSKWAQMLEIIYRAYKVPDDLIEFLNSTLDIKMESTDESKNSI